MPTAPHSRHGLVHGVFPGPAPWAGHWPLGWWQVGVLAMELVPAQVRDQSRGQGDPTGAGAAGLAQRDAPGPPCRHGELDSPCSGEVRLVLAEQSPHGSASPRWAAHVPGTLFLRERGTAAGPGWAASAGRKQGAKSQRKLHNSWLWCQDLAVSSCRGGRGRWLPLEPAGALSCHPKGALRGALGTRSSGDRDPQVLWGSCQGRAICGGWGQARGLRGQRSRLTQVLSAWKCLRAHVRAKDVSGQGRCCAEGTGRVAQDVSCWAGSLLRPLGGDRAEVPSARYWRRSLSRRGARSQAQPPGLRALGSAAVSPAAPGVPIRPRGCSAETCRALWLGDCLRSLPASHAGSVPALPGGAHLLPVPLALCRRLAPPGSPSLLSCRQSSSEAAPAVGAPQAVAA